MAESSALKRLAQAEMRNRRFLRWAYSSYFVLPLRKMGLTTALRNLRYRTVVGSDGIYRTAVGGQSVAFRVLEASDLVPVESCIALHETETLRAVMRGLRPGDTFLDVGADVGLHTVSAALVVGEAGQVIAFEPQMRSLTRLRDNLVLNDLSNVRVFRIALGEKGRPSWLYGRGSVASLVAPRTRSIPATERELVDVVNGDEFWKLHALPAPRVIKIDVEGSEYSVLRGLHRTLSQPATNLLVCEIHPCLLPEGITVSAVRDFVASLGFSEIHMFPRLREIHMIARKGA